jgi:hypothetical protein
MPIQFSLGSGLLRTAITLGFLGCLVAQESLYSQAASSRPLVRAGTIAPSATESRLVKLNNAAYLGIALRFACSDSMLTQQMEIRLPDEFGVAFEDDDSIEMLRVDIHQRAYGIDRVVPRPRVASQSASHTRPNISPPLLV